MTPCVSDPTKICPDDETKCCLYQPPKEPTTADFLWWKREYLADRPTVTVPALTLPDSQESELDPEQTLPRLPVAAV